MYKFKLREFLTLWVSGSLVHRLSSTQVKSLHMTFKLSTLQPKSSMVVRNDFTHVERSLGMRLGECEQAT